MIYESSHQKDRNVREAWVTRLAPYSGTKHVSVHDEGVVSIAQQGYNVLHFPRSMDISFSLVDLSTEETLVNLELYDDDGRCRSAGTVAVAPGCQYARYFADILGEKKKKFFKFDFC